MPKRDVLFRVVGNGEEARGIRRLVLEADEENLPQPEPGQFAMVQVARPPELLLRRPLSYMKAEGSRVEFCYRVIGKGTAALSEKADGDEIKVLGPLGNGFDISAVRSSALLVAGGIGIPPLYFLAGYMMESGIPDVRLVYGARTLDELIFCDELERMGVELVRVTEDDTGPERGLASEAAARTMRRSRPDAVFACGPMPMLEAVARDALSEGLPCRVSVEERMACGVGACLGCTVETKSGYRRTCADGPVFDAEEIFGKG